MKINPKVDTYLIDGCGRCSHYQTPQCKVQTWQQEIRLLRKLVLDCGLQEDYKWSQPCYTLDDRNILMVSAFKDYAFISFFKGSLLEDVHKILVAPGKSSQAVRFIKFTAPQQITKLESTIKAYIYEAIELEKKGLKIQFKKNLEPEPEELLREFEKNIEFKKAFKKLTPGRQRGYIIHFSQAKQSKTRTSRIEKYMQKIMDGKGYFD